jgi:hypothetical protein
MSPLVFYLLWNDSLLTRHTTRVWHDIGWNSGFCVLECCPMFTPFCVHWHHTFACWQLYIYCRLLFMLLGSVQFLWRPFYLHDYCFCFLYLHSILQPVSVFTFLSINSVSYIVYMYSRTPVFTDSLSAFSCSLSLPRPEKIELEN